MRDHLTKAVGLHVADEVWETVDRHLFADASGRRHGPPRIGSWWEFTRIPGRARSHTKTTPAWETYRLVGTLDGHLATYRHPQLPAAVSAARAAAAQPAGTSILAQPARLPAPPQAREWVVVGSQRGVGGGVHRPARPGIWCCRCGCPRGRASGRTWPFSGRSQRLAQDRPGAGPRPPRTRWVAVLRASAGHQGGYQSPATRARRAQIPDRPAGRGGRECVQPGAGVVSRRHPEQLVVDQIGCTPEQQKAAARAAKQARVRQRALDRSRRNTNPDQYGPSVRQAARAARRAARGLAAKQITNPGGPRHARADGVPLRAYRHDSLSGRYHRTRTDHAAEARAASQAKHARAREVAARIVATHGNTITVEDCTISTWARLWGKRIAAVQPRHARRRARTRMRGHRRAAVSGRHPIHRAEPALPVRQRVPKTLSQRTHDCPHCGLVADRDIASAMLAACVKLTDPDDPRTARVDYRLAHALRAGLASQQEWEGSVNRHQPPAPPGAGPARTGSHHPVASAEQAALGPPPNRPSQKPGRHGTSRKQPAPKLFGAA